MLIYGASGTVGTYAVQLAKIYGAEVTAVCSGKNIELVKSLGADYAIDYTLEDFTDSTKSYDLIFDTVGKTSFAQCKRVMTEKGIYLATVAGVPQFAQMISTSIRGGKKLISGLAPMHKEDLLFLVELIEAGKLKSVIDRSYPLDRVAEAHRYVETGHKRGSVVINVIKPDELTAVSD